MTPRAVVVILCLLALLCLASWLFAAQQGGPTTEGDGDATSTPVPTPTPIDLDDVQSKTNDKADVVAAKIDALILSVQDLAATYNAQRDKREAKAKTAGKSVTIINNKIVMPTPVPTGFPAPRPEPTTRPSGGLIPDLLGW